MKLVRGIFARLLMLVLGIVVSLCLTEAVVRFVAFSARDREAGALELWRGYANMHSPTLNPSSDCSFYESLTAHPNFGTVNHRIPPCGNPRSNNLGIPDRIDYPAERDPRFFTVAILGGSVASFLAVGKNFGSWLEDILNRDYKSPNGKPFRIVSGALGGWSYPNQLIFLTLFGHAADAVVAVDGFNEALKVQWGHPLYQQDPTSYLAAARPPNAVWSQRLVVLPFRMRRLALSNPLFRRSFLAFFVFQKTLGAISDPNGLMWQEQNELVNRYFALPADWNDEKIRSWNAATFENYIRMLKSSSETLGLRYAHFVQPTISIGKTLTDEEKTIRKTINPELYKTVFIDVSRRLGAKGFHTASLDSVFNGEKDTIYQDEVHCRFGPPTDSRGYSLISEAIATNLAKMWGLKRR